MAIQHRRGVFNRFDPGRLRPGEWAVVLSGDSSASDGMACYMCFAAGKVKRMATFEDMAANIANANTEIIGQLTEGVTQLEGAIEEAESLRAAAEQGRSSAEQAREAAESARASAEQSRATAEAGRVEAEGQRVLRFAEMEQLANGWLIHHCTADEYDATTRKPAVADPDPGTLYCVPSEDAASGDAWVEWRYDSETGSYEPVGSATANTSPITTATIDAVVAGGAATGTEVLQTTGLAYFFSKLKATFAAIGHKHSASDVDSGILPVARGGTGQTTAAGERSRLGLGDTTGELPVANGGTGATDAATARANLGVTPANIGAAAESHFHSASDVTSGTLPVARGGTGASTVAGARSRLGASRGWYATCDTAAGTAAKEATCPGFVLETGALLLVRFTYANAAASPTLNVNDTGAMAIRGNASTTAANATWMAGETVLLVLDGSCWHMLTSFGNFGTLPVAHGGTGATTAAGAKENIVDGQALAPSSVTATGTVKAATVEDSGGTLAALRESVSKTFRFTKLIISPIAIEAGGSADVPAGYASGGYVLVTGYAYDGMRFTYIGPSSSVAIMVASSATSIGKFNISTTTGKMTNSAGYRVVISGMYAIAGA